MEERKSSQKMVLEQLDFHVPKKKKRNLDIELTHFIKIISKWITDLNVKSKAIKLLQHNIRENLDDLGFDDDTKSMIHERKN